MSESAEWQSFSRNSDFGVIRNRGARWAPAAGGEAGGKRFAGVEGTATVIFSTDATLQEFFRSVPTNGQAPVLQAHVAAQRASEDCIFHFASAATIY